MQKVRITDVEPVVDCATLHRPLTEAIGVDHLAINYYELAPGDSFAYGYHNHTDQEELFLVLAGTVEFTTESGPVTVAEGELIRFAPGEFQQGTNHGDDRVTAIALGAPPEPGETTVFRHCPSCDERTETTIERVDDTTKITRCRSCNTETGRYT